MYYTNWYYPCTIVRELLHVNRRLPLIAGTSILLYVPPLNKGSGGGVGERTGVCVVSDILVSGVGTAGDNIGRTDGDAGLGCNGTLV